MAGVEGISVSAMHPVFFALLLGQFTMQSLRKLMRIFRTSKLFLGCSWLWQTILVVTMRVQPIPSKPGDPQKWFLGLWIGFVNLQQALRSAMLSHPLLAVVTVEGEAPKGSIKLHMETIPNMWEPMWYTYSRVALFWKLPNHLINYPTQKSYDLRPHGPSGGFTNWKLPCRYLISRWRSSDFFWF